MSHQTNSGNFFSLVHVVIDLIVIFFQIIMYLKLAMMTIHQAHGLDLLKKQLDKRSSGKSMVF